MDLLDFIWLTVLILMPIPIAFGWGRYFIALFESDGNIENEPSFAISAFTGFGFIAAFLGVWSLFGPISPYAFLPIGLLGAWLFLNYSPKFKYVIVVAVATALALVISILPPQLNDYYLYYLPTLNWLNRFPALPGLANFQSRLGFNSNWHLIQASLRFDTNWPTVLNLSLWLVMVMGALQTWGDSNASKFKKLIFCFFPLPVYIIYKYLNVPSPDFPVMVVTFLIIMLSWEIVERKSKAVITLYILAFIGIGIKASAVALLAFPVGLTFYLNQKSRILNFTLLGFLLLGPFLIRNFIISGYWVYPLPITGFIKPDWQVPASILLEETAYVKASGKIPAGYTLQSAELGLLEWFPVWIKYQKATHLILLLSAVSMSIILFIRALKETKYYFILFPYLLALGFWFLTAPNPRFAYGLLFTALFGILAHLGERLIKSDGKTLSLFTGGAVALALVAFVATAVKVKPLQVDLSELNFKKITSGNIVFYEASKNGLCGSGCFPCTNYLTPNLELRGKDLEKGFRIRKDDSTRQ